jgi:maltooligosyltrehalose trehalohydrolase
VGGAGDGSRYRYRLDLDNRLYPDPASRFQPEGPHGPSQVVDPSRFAWTDGAWKGTPRAGQVIYEMHIGTFTGEGTWAAAVREFPELVACGITLLEVMPVADFPGRFGWGYDGVDLFAPTRLYGTPDDFRRFVDQAHAAGLGVLLDVVYNHFGPDGNYLTQFADGYLTDRYKNEWGQAINFDGDNSGPVREFVVANAGYWIDEYHIDGLRLDATQQIFDTSPDSVMAALTRRAREMARGRAVYVVAENEPQVTKLVRTPEQGGYGMDALWNDDWHHSTFVALTGHNPAYYKDYRGEPQELISAAKYGYLYQGEWHTWQEQRRGSPTFDLPPDHFVVFLENHDQVANSGRGQRMHQQTSPGRYRALTALLLLGPQTPMLFQGQEFAASSPFFYFADHNPDLARLVSKGRAKFLAQFPRLATAEGRTLLRDPADPTTFTACKLDFSERAKNKDLYAMTRDLLRRRREDPVFRAPRHRGVDGAVLSPHAFVLRFFAADGMDRLLVVNLGHDLHLLPAPEPLLAPPEAMAWSVLWSSESIRYGGTGTPPIETFDAGWWLPGEAAVVLAPGPRSPDQPASKSGAEDEKE